MLNKQGKLDVKIFFCYINITIFVSGHFFLNYPVDYFKLNKNIYKINICLELEMKKCLLCQANPAEKTCF